MPLRCGVGLRGVKNSFQTPLLRAAHRWIASVPGFAVGFSLRGERCPCDGWSPAVAGDSFKGHQARAPFEALVLSVSPFLHGRSSVPGKENEQGQGHPEFEDGII